MLIYLNFVFLYLKTCFWVLKNGFFPLNRQSTELFQTSHCLISVENLGCLKPNLSQLFEAFQVSISKKRYLSHNTFYKDLKVFKALKSIFNTAIRSMISTVSYSKRIYLKTEKNALNFRIELRFRYCYEFYFTATQIGKENPTTPPETQCYEVWAFSVDLILCFKLNNKQENKMTWNNDI